MRLPGSLIAGLGLLVAACHDAEPPKAPPPGREAAAVGTLRQPRSGLASQVSLSRAESQNESEGQGLRPSVARAPGNGGGNGGNEARSDAGLNERFARAPALSTLHGSASYYADSLAGRTTASGAPYEPQRFSAAHRSLPFGTVLRVTRAVDAVGGGRGQVVYVRVTDRGPYGSRGRILDLSRAAAEELGMLRAGVVKVRVDVLQYGPPRKKRRRRR